MKVIALGNGKVKITPALVDDVQSLLFEITSERHPIGVETGDPPGIVYPNEEDVLIMFGNIESAKVLLHQLQRCIEELEAP